MSDSISTGESWQRCAWFELSSTWPWRSLFILSRRNKWSFCFRNCFLPCSFTTGFLCRSEISFSCFSNLLLANIISCTCVSHSATSCTSTHQSLPNAQLASSFYSVMRQLPKEGKKTLWFGSDRNIRGNLSSRIKKTQNPKISIHLKSDRKRMCCLKCTDIVLVLAISPDQVRCSKCSSLLLLFKKVKKKKKSNSRSKSVAVFLPGLQITLKFELLAIVHCVI